jgi:heme/copper-type cytochrome/quinol oxidase subunit 2
VRRDIWIPLAIWGVVTLASIGIAAFLMDPFPTQGTEEARLSDDAFMAMTFLAAPVFGVVIAGLAYSLWFHRSRGESPEDGVPLQGTGTAPRVWLVATVALAAVVMVDPGLTGLAELREGRCSLTSA